MIYLGWGNSAHTLGAQVYDWREELKEHNSTHTPSAQVYDWCEELTEQARGRNMDSGASAVLVRRQLIDVPNRVEGLHRPFADRGKW